MSKNVIINGTTYSGISEVSLPISGGTAKFKDEDEIIVPAGTIEISTNGTHNVKTYENAIVNVPVGIAPSGSITVTENGTFDVTNYASVVVNVPSNSELTLTGISATYSGGTVAAGTTVEQLSGITVTATYTATGYTGNITKTVTGYSLSGTLTAGQTNTVTVSYGGKTTTFEVTVNEEVTLSSISATYTGGAVAAGTTLEQLTGITVTATYSDGSTSTVPSSGYSLSGTLTPGQTNTITVSYSGKTATFEVTVEAESNLPTGVSRVETLTFTATADIGQSQTIEHSWGSTPPTYIIMKRDGEASSAWAVDGYIIHNGDTNSYPRHHNATSHGPLSATQAPSAIFTENGIQINSASSSNKWYDSSSSNNTFTVVAVWLS